MKSERKTYRQEMAEKTKQLILKTAIKLFQRHGYENVTISDIVKAAKTSRGGFYVHFKNKDDLLVKCLFDVDEKYLDFYQNVLLGPEYAGRNALQLLELYYVHVNRIFTQNGPEMMRHYYSYTMLNPYILIREDRHYFAIARELLVRCRADRLINDLYTDEQILEMGLMLNRSIAIDWALRSGAYPIESKDELIHAFFRQIKA